MHHHLRAWRSQVSLFYEPPRYFETRKNPGPPGRESKLLAVHRSWIREEADGWWLILSPSQSRFKGTPTRIPLNTSALWALRDPLPSLSDGRVFRRWDDVRAFKKYWARVCGLAKIQDLHFHDLRYTLATRLQGLGVDYEAQQVLLGHRMPGMTANYSHGGSSMEPQASRGRDDPRSRLQNVLWIVL